MSDKKDWRLRVLHMREQIEKIKTYTAGMTMDQLSSDEKTTDAVIRCLQIIGEAAKKVPPDIQSLYPAIEWKKIAGLRDVLVHDYDGVDTEIVHGILNQRLPALEEKLAKIPVSKENL
jgi:uncharacterized protein with HEPN domain